MRFRRERKSEEDLRAFALESIIKHGSSVMSEKQKVDLARDCVKMSGLSLSVEKGGTPSKEQRNKAAEEMDTAPSQSSTHTTRTRPTTLLLFLLLLIHPPQLQHLQVVVNLLLLPLVLLVLAPVVS